MRPSCWQGNANACRIRLLRMFHRLIRASIHDKSGMIVWIESKDDDSVGSGIDHASSIADSFKARKHETLQIQRKLDSSLETVLSPLSPSVLPSRLSNLKKVYCNRRRILRKEDRKNRVAEPGRYTSIGKPSATDRANVAVYSVRYMYAHVHVYNIRICMRIYVCAITSVSRSFSRQYTTAVPNRDAPCH